jgi:hypothetical protein
MTDKKAKKLQEKAQAAAYDLFNTLTRMGIYETHLMLGDRLTGEFEELTLSGLQEAALLSDIDDVTITLRPRLEKMVDVEIPPEEPVGD